MLHLITGLQTGGAERQLSLLLQADRGNGISHAVISLGDAGGMADSIFQLGVPVQVLGVRKSLSGALTVPTLLKLVRKQEPELLQGWMYHGNLAASVAGRVAHCKVVWNVRHSLSDFNREKKLTRLAIRAGATLSRSAARTIYNSGTSAAQHKSAGYKGQPLVIPNGYDSAAFRYDGLGRAKIRAELAFEDSDVVVGCVARFHPMKDHGNFLRAAAKLKERYARTRFLLVGSGVTEANEEIYSLVGELGLFGSVRLLGEREDMAHLYSAMDVVVSSSSWGEAVPNVLGEAMACGVPCVATDVGDTRLLVGKTGVIVPPRDPESLASAMLELCRAGRGVRRALGSHARKRIQEQYSLETMAERYAALYHSVGKN